MRALQERGLMSSLAVTLCLCVASGTCNPRVTLKYGSVQHKTPIVKQNRSPIWNDTVLLYVRSSER